MIALFKHDSIWVASSKGGGPVSSGFQYTAALTELTHLAIKPGGMIEWNAEKCQVANRPEAAKLIRRPCRAGWELD